jgi:hypothetical protein
MMKKKKKIMRSLEAAVSAAAIPSCAAGNAGLDVHFVRVEEGFRENSLENRGG